MDVFSEKNLLSIKIKQRLVKNRGLCDADEPHFIITNTETFNKFLLTISSAAFAFIYYVLKGKPACAWGYKICAFGFVTSILLTMLALELILRHPQRSHSYDAFIGKVDSWAFYIFSFSLILLCIVFAGTS